MRKSPPCSNNTTRTPALSSPGPLLAFRKQGDGPDSREKLAASLESNSHVSAFLLGKKKLPRILPDLVGFGDESEAICYASDNLAVWQATSGALVWLAERINSEKPTLLN